MRGWFVGLGRVQMVERELQGLADMPAHGGVGAVRVTCGQCVDDLLVVFASKGQPERIIAIASYDENPEQGLAFFQGSGQGGIAGAGQDGLVELHVATDKPLDSLGRQVVVVAGPGEGFNHGRVVFFE